MCCLLLPFRASASLLDSALTDRGGRANNCAHIGPRVKRGLGAEASVHFAERIEVPVAPGEVWSFVWPVKRKAGEIVRQFARNVEAALRPAAPEAQRA